MSVRRSVAEAHRGVSRVPPPSRVHPFGRIELGGRASAQPDRQSFFVLWRWKRYEEALYLFEGTSQDNTPWNYHGSGWHGPLDDHFPNTKQMVFQCFPLP